MTTPVGFTFDRCTAGINLSPGAGTQPTLRAMSTSVFDVNAASVAVTWPSGTIAGDMVLIFSHHGYNTNAPAGWTTLDRTTYNTNHGGAVFYKIMDASDITAGGVTVTFGGNWAGGVLLVTYEDGADLALGVIAQVSSTGARPAGTWALSYAAESTRAYCLFGSARDGAVSFSVATADLTQAITTPGPSPRYLAFAEMEPSPSTSVNETVTFASTPNGYYGILVSITKDAPSSGVYLIASSTAISTASESTRQGVGNLYYEALVALKAGIVSIGLSNFYYSVGAVSLGTNTNSLAYNSDGTVKVNNTTLATISTFTTGDRVSVAYDRSQLLAWFKVNAGSWNNDGTADPATGVGGIDVSSFIGGQYYPAIGFSVGGSTVQAAFAATDWTYSAPTGFNSIQDTVVNIADSHDNIAFADMAVGPDHPSDWFVVGEMPTDNFSYAVSFPAGPIKLIAGTVEENGVGVAGKLVRMYNKRTGQFVGEAITNGSGDFSISAQDPNLPHFVVAFDDPTYNAKVYDNVLPG